MSPIEHTVSPAEEALRFMPVDTGPDDPRETSQGGLGAELEAAALEATRTAARACQRWVGRGSGVAADGAATEAMRSALALAPGTGLVVIGEGAKDEAPMLYDGERLGTGEGPSFEVAVDPLECTKLCAKGLAGSLATIAVAGQGAMARLGPAFYMDKLVGPPQTRGVLDITSAPERNAERAAEALGKPIDELRVLVLDKPRHVELTDRLHAIGARVVSPPDGDVAGSLAALLPAGDIDLLMGVGGTPEGVMSACAARALGGWMQGRLAPQREEEQRAIKDAGLDLERVYGLDDLVTGECFFVATGVTTGPLLRGPRHSAGGVCTESIVVRSGSVRTIVDIDQENDR